MEVSLLFPNISADVRQKERLYFYLWPIYYQAAERMERADDDDDRAHRTAGQGATPRYDPRSAIGRRAARAPRNHTSQHRNVTGGPLSCFCSERSRTPTPPVGTGALLRFFEDGRVPPAEKYPVSGNSFRNIEEDM